MTISLVGVCLFCALWLGVDSSRGHHLRSHEASRPHQRGRELRGERYYNYSAMDFLRYYGKYYHLFDSFFDANTTIVYDDFYSKRFGNSSSYNPKKAWHSKNTTIADKYDVRDYSHFGNLFRSKAKVVNPDFLNVNYSYSYKTENADLLRYQNRFRYGADREDDRFYNVGFDKDPWCPHNKPISATFSKAQAEENPFLYFIGVENDFPQGDFQCKFTYPAVATSPLHVTRHLVDVLARPTKNNIIKCQLPKVVLDAINGTVNKVVFDLVELKKNSVEQPVLNEITVYRSHSLDCRQFTVVAQTMLELLDDVMVREWIIYNILLGTEHFYIYHNVKSTKADYSKSILKPFLDANIITVIHYPILHTVTYAVAQHAAMNDFLNLYGYYTEWTSYWDIDEFYLPSRNLIDFAFTTTMSNFQYNYDVSILRNVVKHFAPGTEPGIMFDTLDMDCEPEDISGYYPAGNNVELKKQIKDAVSGNSTRRSVTSHCTRSGFYFHEMTVGHGKMLIRPAKVEYMMSPHRLNDYWVVWSSPDNGGLMRHFNRFRNTNLMIASGKYSQNQIGHRDDLKHVTLWLLKYFLGVYADPDQGTSLVIP